ncbi:hypothetical protein [Mycoplasma sp. E35C]|uniref:hypothetical protein n=1 Tax=Mycoplasma sp. E35C TaxID=2801918 RepID=UPI001CA3A0D6|nr:hypothetical protein [Mycoplasma sp. E35C]QZX49402.1 hypothetical protein JJE79_01490 [Mycoplasma sp. E35C]
MYEQFNQYGEIEFNQHEEIKEEIERIQNYRRSFIKAKLFFALFLILSFVGWILILVFNSSGDTSTSQIIGVAAMSGIGWFGTVIMSIVTISVYSKIYREISSTPNALIIIGIFIFPFIIIPIGLAIATKNMRKLQEMKENELSKLSNQSVQ